MQQRPNLRHQDAVLEPALDERPVLAAHRAHRARHTRTPRADFLRYAAQQLIGRRRRTFTAHQAQRRRRVQVAPRGFAVHAHDVGGRADAFARLPNPQNIFDFCHQHLPVRHAALQPKRAGLQHDDSRARRDEVVPSLWRQSPGPMLVAAMRLRWSLYPGGGHALDEVLALVHAVRFTDELERLVEEAA